MRPQNQVDMRSRKYSGPNEQEAAWIPGSVAPEDGLSGFFLSLFARAGSANSVKHPEIWILLRRSLFDMGESAVCAENEPSEANIFERDLRPRDSKTRD